MPITVRGRSASLDPAWELVAYLLYRSIPLGENTLPSDVTVWSTSSPVVVKVRGTATSTPTCSVRYVDNTPMRGGAEPSRVGVVVTVTRCPFRSTTMVTGFPLCDRIA